MKPSTEALPDKRGVRRQLRAARDSLSPAQRQAYIQQANVHLTRWERWSAVKVVGSYLPHESEFDPIVLTRGARARGTRVACPRVMDKALCFHDWKEGDAVEATIGGVLQPTEAARTVRAEDIDLFLTPLLGCGEDGARLGYGGGFYDRLFAEVTGFRLGVGFALQRAADWETEAHDQRLHGFLCEEGLTLFS